MAAGLTCYDAAFAAEQHEHGKIRWDLQVIDSDGDTGWYTSLALDLKTHFPLISYYNHTYGDLRFARWDGSRWNIETVDSKGQVGWYSHLALDPKTGYPRIAYHDITNRDAKYAEWTGKKWKIQVVDSQGRVGRYTCLKLDPKTGYPRISYYDWDNRSLKFAAWDGKRWERQTVHKRAEGEGFVGVYADLVLNPATGFPLIAYLTQPDCHLEVAIWNGSSWDIQVADGAPNVGRYPCIILDRNGDPHIVHYDYANDALRYTKWQDGQWKTEIVDTGHRLGKFPIICLEPGTEFPRISYHEEKDYTLRCAIWDGSSWDIYTVDAGGIQNSMVLDPQTGLPIISHYDYISKTLRFARALPPEPAAQSSSSP